MGIVEQERKALDRFVGQPAPAGLLPGQVLIEDLNLVSRQRQLLASHRACGSATDDCNH